MTFSRRLAPALLCALIVLCVAFQPAYADEPADDAGSLAAGSAQTASQPASAPKVSAKPSVSYRVYAKGAGWSKGWAKSGKTAGKQALRMQLVKIKANKDGLAGKLSYRVKPAGKHWTKWATGGRAAGTKGKAVTGVQVKLSGKLASYFDVAYRVYHADQGWLPWTLNGRTAGCIGGSGLSQLQVKLVKKGSAQAVPDGAYVIALAKDSRHVLSAPAGKAANGTQLTKGAYAQGAIGERFYVRNEAHGTLSIQSVATGKFLREQAGKVVLGRDGSDASYRWVLGKWKGGYTLANAASGKRIAVVGKKAVVGKAKARWTFSRVNLVGDGTYTVSNSAHGKVLAIEGSGAVANAGAMVVASGSLGKGAQSFTFAHKGSELYRIDCAGTFKTLEVASGSKKAGAAVRQATRKSSNSQKWKARLSRSGGLVFKNKASGKVLAASSGGRAGSRVVSAAQTGSAAQLWTLASTHFKGNRGLARCIEKAQGMGSSTRYLITVDLTNHWLAIFTKSSSGWKLYKNWQVSNGKGSTPTVAGTYTVGIKLYSFGHGYTCYYATQFYGNYLFHSVLYHEGTRSVKDGRLGQAISMGCVRMKIENAKWIYDHIPGGTKVRTFR